MSVNVWQYHERATQAVVACLCSRVGEDGCEEREKMMIAWVSGVP